MSASRRYGDTGSIRVRARARARLARNARTYEITLANGSKIRRTSSDPGRALLTGFVGGVPAAQDDWNKLDVPALRGISKTAPYFHNNSAATLEEVVDHYMEFFKRVEANLAPRGRATGREHRRHPFRSAERPAPGLHRLKNSM